jgi:hypothetical protein
MDRRSFLTTAGSLTSYALIGGRDGRCGTGQDQKPRVWPSNPPADCPFLASSAIKGLAFTGRYASYAIGDNWFPSWAADDNLYSTFTDGEAAGVRTASYAGAQATTGYIRITGSNPLELKLGPAGSQTASAWPYSGRYPCANLVHNGVCYCGTYCLDSKNPHLGFDVLGPFVGFRMSRNYGKSWSDTRLTPTDPIFLENGKNGSKVKMGAPHFVDFGKNMQHSPDGKAYLIGHGAVRSDAPLSWISGDQVYLARVEPTPHTINDLSKYDFFAGHDAKGRPIWTSNFASIRPLIEWEDRTGCVTATYNPGLKKYLVFITDGFPIIAPMNTYILESDYITGPWRLVTFMAHFGEQAYFVNMPSKFLKSDGRSAWLAYSANFVNNSMRGNLKSDPPGGGFALSLQEVNLIV